MIDSPPDRSRMARPSPVPLKRPSPSTRPYAAACLAVLALFGTGAVFHTYSAQQTTGQQTTAQPSSGAAASGDGTKAHTAIPLTVQLSMLSPNNAMHALQHSAFDATTRAQIAAALNRGDIRLAQLPVLDSLGLTGQSIDITTTGLTQRVILSGQFQPVLLPITTAGLVTITPATHLHSPGLSVTVLTALGPQMLPALTSQDQMLELNVIVQ